MRSRAEAAPSLLYLPELAAAGDRVTLPADESHYLLRVCRARVGDTATATDGRGLTARVRVVAIERATSVEIETRSHEPVPRRAWILCGAVDGPRADWLVEKLAELGVTRWQPIACRGGDWPAGGGRRERWERLATAALRQSRRAWRMEIGDPLPLGPAMNLVPADGPRWLGRLDGVRLPVGGADATCSAVAIGPAPGFSGEEEAALERAGFQPVRLAAARLRAETAALAWAAWWATTGAPDPAG